MDDNVEILRRYNRWRRGQALWNAAADFPNPRVVDEAIDAACDEIERLRAELETERMRLAACSVIALANTPESAASARGIHPDYRSASCDDVARAVDREIALRAENEALNAVYKAAKRCVANPAWAGICDEDVELELAVAALAAKED